MSKSIEETLMEAVTYKGFRKGMGVINNIEAIATSISIIENTKIIEKLIEKEDKIIELLNIIAGTTIEEKATEEVKIPIEDEKVVEEKSAPKGRPSTKKD